MDRTTQSNPDEIFNDWSRVLAASAATGVLQFEGSILWKLKGEQSGSWLMTGGRQPGIEKREARADCTLILNVNDFLQIASGELNPQLAYLNGLIEVQGDLSTVLQLGVLLDQFIARSGQR